MLFLISQTFPLPLGFTASFPSLGAAVLSGIWGPLAFSYECVWYRGRALSCATALFGCMLVRLTLHQSAGEDRICSDRRQFA